MKFKINKKPRNQKHPAGNNFFGLNLLNKLRVYVYCLFARLSTYSIPFWISEVVEIILKHYLRMTYDFTYPLLTLYTIQQRNQTTTGKKWVQKEQTKSLITPTMWRERCSQIVLLCRWKGRMGVSELVTELKLLLSTYSYNLCKYTFS